jgi:amino acid adenylation domain-containing protein
MLVQRHEALRTAFSMMEEQLVQVIAPSQVIPLTVFDLREQSGTEQEAQSQSLTAEQVQQAFVLSQGPLLRCTLLHLADEEYRLLLTAHRIICDEWALGVLVRDLACLYEACSASESPSLPWQYTDFSVWQRQVLTTEILDEHLAYWRHQLAGIPDMLQLPTDHLRQAAISSQSSMCQIVLPCTLIQALQQLSQQQAVNLDMILVAAFQTLLYRYTGQEDVVIGTVTPARLRAETEEMIGACENMLVLRTDLSGQPSFAQLLERVREMMVTGQAHEELPFESLVKALYPTRSLSHNPLFQVLLQLPHPWPVLPSSWTLEQVAEGIGSQFDLTLKLQEGPQGLISCFTYSTDLFDEATIVRMAGHWQTLLAGIVADPAQPVTRLPLLTTQERFQLLEEWNDTHKQYPLDQCLHQLFEAQVQRTPQFVAVICKDEQLSYQELNAHANRLAHQLREHGVGPDEVVALLAERDIPFLVSILAIFKAGGAYLPLDPHHPSARLRQVIELSGCSIVLSTAAFLPTLALALEEVPAELRQELLPYEEMLQAGYHEDNFSISNTSRDLAYVIYTSGSTGQPKGAMVEQRGMVNHIYAKIEALTLTSRDKVAQTASQCFDISVWQFLAALLIGGSVQIYPDEVAHHPVQLLTQVERHQISILETVPSLMRAMLDADEIKAVDRPRLEALRWLIPTGEALPIDLCQRWLCTYPHVPLINAYGPTECSDDVTHYPIYQAPDESRSSIPIGRAIPNMRLYVLDRYLEPLPIGVSGELYVGGIGVGRGYLGDKQRTEESFVPDPFASDDGARLYKTGDLARYLPDGNLEFLGRLDFQVKVRGFRIELGEIEAVLSRHPAVRMTVVMAREDMPGDKRLVAYVEIQKGQTISAAELKSHLTEHMPAYMVPSAFVLLELPLTPNGKIDRRALPMPKLSRDAANNTFVAPTLALHHQLVQIWEDLLGVQQIGIKDNFFELGGDSLLAVRLFARIEQVCGKKLPFSTFFAGATIECLATALMEEAKVDSRAPVVRVQAGDGSKRPFFYLHGDWSAGGFYSLEMARYLGSDQPFYLLEPYQLDSLAVLPTFEAIAAAHLETMRAIQPEGPYMLGGCCNGGNLSHEIAKQLHAQGQAVDLLVLFNPELRAAPIGNRLIRGVVSCIAKVIKIGRDKQLDWFLRVQHIHRYLRLAHYRQAKNAELLGEAIQGELGYQDGQIGSRPPRFSLRAFLAPRIETLRNYSNKYDWIHAGYKPRDLFTGKITLFWTREDFLCAKEWQIEIKAQKKQEVEINLLPGNHVTSRTEHLPALAECLRTCLIKAQADNINPEE